MTVIESGNIKWQVAKKSISGVQGCLTPRPRFGHRVVSMRGLILLFGGGDKGIIDDLLVYSTENGNWFQPSTNGNVPNGVAAFGMAADGTRIIIHGGMLEYGKMSNHMYELQASKWEWKKLDQKCSKSLKSVPTSRMCHSFVTLGGMNGIPCIDKIVLFGGARNSAENPEKQFKPEYLNDLYYLELLTGSGVGNWIKPDVTGSGPSPRESHSAIIYKPDGRSHMVVIYGGKDRTRRLSDIFTLDTGTNTWTELKPLGNPPKSRSLHTALLVSNNRMVIIGGIVPKDESKDKMFHDDDPSGDTVWESDSSIYVLDLAADEWLETGFSGPREQEKLPRSRSHAAAALIDTRIYLFAGIEEGKACNSMLFLETSAPVKPQNLRLLKGGETSIEVAWNPVKHTDKYLVQICPMGIIEKKKKIEPKKEIKPLGAEKKSNTEVPDPKPLGTQKSELHNTGERMETSIEKQNSDRLNNGIGATTEDKNEKPKPFEEKKETTMQENSQEQPQCPAENVVPENSSNDQKEKTAAADAEMNTKDLDVTEKISTQPDTGDSVLLDADKPEMKPIQLPLLPSSLPIKLPTPLKLPNSSPISQNTTPVLLVTQSVKEPSTENASTALVKHKEPNKTDMSNEEEGSQTPTRDEQEDQMDAEKESHTKTSNIDITEKTALTEALQTKIEKAEEKLNLDEKLTEENSKIEEKPKLEEKPKTDEKLKPEEKQELKDKTKFEEKTKSEEKAKVEEKSMIEEKTKFETHNQSQTVLSDVAKPTNEPILKAKDPVKKEDPIWYDVALTHTTRFEIKSYYVESNSQENIITEEDYLFLDNKKMWRKQALGSGITYRVRICAVNSCGRSIFSDHSAYKTIVPGFPRAPTSIKVSKTDDGASLSWSPPVNTEIIEYSVYLAVKQSQTTGKTNNFIRVYLGDQPNCVVSHAQLAQAATNTESSNKPAVIFRIAAKNKKGYGPATQVRWLQDSRVKRQAQNIKNEAAKKAKPS